MSDTESIYDAYAAAWWDGSVRWLRQLQKLGVARFAYFDELIPDWRDLHVLDLGCGGGYMAEALARRGARVIGVDPSGPALDIAKRHAQADGLSIDYRRGVGEGIPVELASIDIVVCVDVLEHVVDLDQVIAEVRRVLKPGGQFVFDTINRTPMSAFIMVVLAERVLTLLPKGTHDATKFVRPSELRAALEAANFSVSAFVGFGPRFVDRDFDFQFGRVPTTSRCTSAQPFRRHAA